MTDMNSSIQILCEEKTLGEIASKTIAGYKIPKITSTVEFLAPDRFPSCIGHS